jgi:hypothetical protein
MFTTCKFGFDKPLEFHFDNVLNHPYNAFSVIRVGKWEDGHNNNGRTSSKLEKVDAQMGYTS